MNELTLPPQFSREFPHMAQGLLKGMKEILEVQSFEDIERVFLKGAGLSPHTYRSYLQAVRQFYEVSGGLHPLQVKPSDIEAYYDNLVKNGMKRDSAQTRMRGLKRFFDGVKKEVPFFESPFETMSEKLHQKLFWTQRGNRTLPALTEAELRALLAYLGQQTGIRGLRDRAIVLTLSTTGLRATELCQLTWGKVAHVDNRYLVYFIGKGDKEAQQEIQPEALQALRNYFKAQFDREPDSGDALLYTLENYRGRKPDPLTPHTLWDRVRVLGREVTDAGVIRREMTWSPHMFRRTAATIFYKRTKDIKATQAFTRHAQAETLLRHYVDSEIPAREVFGQVLAGVAI